VTERANPPARPESAASQTTGANLRNVRFRTGAVIALAVAVGLIVWLALRDTSSGSGKGVSPSDLQSLATSVGHPVFWLGPQKDNTYELTRRSDGSIIVRYLPPGVGIGAQGQYWSIATYPYRGAFTAIQRVLRQGATRIKLAHRGLAEYTDTNPNNVHAAYPGLNYQVEVFAPGGQAVALVRAGRLTSFGGPEGGAVSAAKPKAATLAELRSIARSLGHPLYWAGPKKGYTYELNRNPNGTVFIRYLPPGVRVGASRKYQSVATYPFPGALAGIQRTAREKNQRTIKLAGGGLVVFNPTVPTNVHLAFPGSDYQIEVFDPAGEAKRIVSAGRIIAIR
jgi:hypothetical protein